MQTLAHEVRSIANVAPPVHWSVPAQSLLHSIVANDVLADGVEVKHLSALNGKMQVMNGVRL